MTDICNSSIVPLVRDPLYLVAMARILISKKSGTNAVSPL